MQLKDVDARSGKTREWVWVARPTYLFEEDGHERADLAPVERGARDRCADARRAAAAHTPGRRTPAIEKQLEEWLAGQPEVLAGLVGGPVEVIGTQLPCGAERGGIIDLLLRRTDERQSLLVLELKAGPVRRDAVAQALGYLGWLTSRRRRVRTARAIVIGLDAHPQVRWVLAMLDDEVEVRHWDDIPLPPYRRSLIAAV